MAIVQYFAEIIKELTPVGQGLITAAGGYFLASLKTRSKYRDIELRSIEQARKEIFQVYDLQIESLNKGFDRERDRLHQEVEVMRQKIREMERSITAITESAYKERERQDQLLAGIREERYIEKIKYNEMTQTNEALKKERRTLLAEIEKQRIIIDEQAQQIKQLTTALNTTLSSNGYLPETLGAEKLPTND